MINIYQNKTKILDNSIGKPFFIFLIFALHGPSIQIVGQLRITEIILILIGLFNFKKILRYLGKNELLIAFLLLLTALSYVFFDALNQGVSYVTFKRAGSYCILSSLFLIVAWMVGKEKNKMLAAIIGFAFSFVIIWFFEITIPNNNFHDTPWRLGLGESISVIALCLCAVNPRYKLLTAIAFLIIVLVHLFSGARNLSLISLTVIYLMMFSYFF